MPSNLKRPNPFFQKAILPAFAFFAAITLFLTSCAEKKETPSATEETDVTAKQFELYGIKYDSSDIQKWIDDTITFRRFVFQFHTTDLKSPTKDLSLISYTLQNDGNWANGDAPDTLKVIEDSLYKFSGPVALGNVEKSIPYICRLVKNPNGSTVAYDHIFLTPGINKKNNHLTYIISVVKDNKKVIEILQEEEELNPVPPGKPEENVQ